MDPLALAICLLVVCIATAIQGSIGFGLTFISAPILGLLVPELVPAPLVLVSVPLVLLLFWTNRRGVDWPAVGWALAGCTVGTAVAAVALAFMDQRTYELLFGVGVLAAVLVSIGGWRPVYRPRNIVLAGLFSGLMATITAIGGPPMALFFQGADGTRLRGSLSAFFAASCFVIVPALWFAGRIGRAELELAAWLLPGVLAGVLIARRFTARLDAGLLRPLLLGVCAVGGLVLIGRVLLRLFAA